MVDYMKLMIHHKHELKTVYFYTIVYTQRAATKICYKKKRFYMTSAAYCELHHFFWIFCLWGIIVFHTSTNSFYTLFYWPLGYLKTMLILFSFSNEHKARASLTSPAGGDIISVMVRDSQVV